LLFKNFDTTKINLRMILMLIDLQSVE